MSQHYEDQSSHFLMGMVAAIANNGAPLCESPIEVGMLYGFISMWMIDRRLKIDTFYHTAPLETEWSARLHIQYPAAQWRLDFAIHVEARSKGATLSRWIAVECDGHEFHDRTREQAARDKARDRELAALGYTVLRFTGSEIYRDAPRCALEALSLADNMITEWQESLPS